MKTDGIEELLFVIYSVDKISINELLLASDESITTDSANEDEHTFMTTSIFEIFEWIIFDNCFIELLVHINSESITGVDFKNPRNVIIANF